MYKLKVLDLFSGIGGFSYGLEKTGGFETVAFCEMDEYADRVLEKHWPDVPCYQDVATLTKEKLNEDGIEWVDVICGGFPCQDISTAGRGAGLEGERSGLWFEYLRLIDEMGPNWVIIENVSALRSRGLSTVLQNLSEIGYDAEWHCIPASHVGAPHRRDRIWIVAYPRSAGLPRQGAIPERGSLGTPVDEREAVELGKSSSSQETMAHTDSASSEGGGLPGGIYEKLKDLDGCGARGREITAQQWAVEPDVGRVAHGVPVMVDRLRCLGNAVVPQITEFIAHAILEVENDIRL